MKAQLQNCVGDNPLLQPVALHFPQGVCTRAPCEAFSVSSRRGLQANCTRAGNYRSVHQRERQLLVSARGSFDDEFRSPRNVALGLHRRYKEVLERGLAEHLTEFIRAGVTAYAVGCTEEGLRKELLRALGHAAAEVGTGMEPSAATKQEVEECILWVTIVFTTIMSSPPPTIVRWSSSAAVSSESLLEWKGFCGIIANAYYNRGMAWLPVKTLQMEQMAVLGRAEEACLVADRMRLAFTTLEIICPQWPKH